MCNLGLALELLNVPSRDFLDFGQRVTPVVYATIRDSVDVEPFKSGQSSPANSAGLRNTKAVHQPDRLQHFIFGINRTCVQLAARLDFVYQKFKVD